MEGELYGATVWRGSALSNCSSQEITFLHERDFGVNTTTVTAFRNCYSSNNSIVAHSLRVENGSYISQLNVTVTNSDIIGKSIECAYDSQRDINSTTTVGSLNVLKPGIIWTLIIVDLVIAILATSCSIWPGARP